MNRQATVFIVDDDETARKSISALVRSIGLRVEAFDSAESLLNTQLAERPGCIITDLRMHRMSGVELQEELRRRHVLLPVIVVTAYAETPVTVRVMRNGAVTLLEKPPRSHELIEAINNALVLDEQARVTRNRQRDLQRRLTQLTADERRVMELMIQGMLNKVIAAELGVSTRTVETRRRKIFQKTRTASVAELVRFVMESQEDDA